MCRLFVSFARYPEFDKHNAALRCYPTLRVCSSVFGTLEICAITYTYLTNLKNSLHVNRRMISRDLDAVIRSSVQVESPISATLSSERNIVNKTLLSLLQYSRRTDQLCKKIIVAGMSSIRVVARIRPQQDLRKEGECIISTASINGVQSSQPNVVRIPNVKNENEVYSFQFSSVYDQSSTQQTIFDNESGWTI